MPGKTEVGCSGEKRTHNILRKGSEVLEQAAQEGGSVITFGIFQGKGECNTDYMI